MKEEEEKKEEGRRRTKTRGNEKSHALVFWVVANRNRETQKRRLASCNRAPHAAQNHMRAQERIHVFPNSLI